MEEKTAFSRKLSHPPRSLRHLKRFRALRPNPSFAIFCPPSHPFPSHPLTAPVAKPSLYETQNPGRPPSSRTQRPLQRRKPIGQGPPENGESRHKRGSQSRL